MLPCRYAFIEFTDEAEAEKAKAELAAKNFNVFVDYVGEKSSKESGKSLFAAYHHCESLLKQALLQSYKFASSEEASSRLRVGHQPTSLGRLGSCLGPFGAQTQGAISQMLRSTGTRAHHNKCIMCSNMYTNC